MHPFFTIGHSTRTIHEFVELLQQSGIRHLVDVRTVPRSRTNPQFNTDVLAESLASCQIAYRHIAGLGGLRGQQRQADHSSSALWRNQSFRNYAEYSQTEAFETALQQLIDVGSIGRAAIMCAEAVWWRCHRRIIADHLLAKGYAVYHIMGAGHATEATLTPGAIPGGHGVSYPLPAAP